MDAYTADAGIFAESLFARGYIISDASVVCPKHWKRLRFEDIYVAHDPKIHVKARRRRGAALLTIGIIFNTTQPNLSQDDEEARLIDGLAESEAEFFERVNDSGGRFVLMYKTSGGEFSLLNDAAGLRSAVYGFGDSRVVSSHMRLTAANLPGSEQRPVVPYRMGYPGCDTPVKGVNLLTPNTKLVWADMRPQRYWPTEPLAPMTRKEALEAVVTRLVNSYTWLSANFDPFISITAGTDSRVTLAVAKTTGRYVTYYRSEERDTDELDRDFAVLMAKTYGLDHTLLVSRDMEPIPPELKTVFDINSYYRHLPEIANLYRTHLVRSDKTVHIRSNLSEIGRMFYKTRIKMQGRVKPFSPGVIETVDDALRMWNNKETLQTEDHRRAFEHFLEVTAFTSAPVEKSSLFYWEHRMGAWHSQICTESDLACESLSLYNCRNLLKTMLSLPQADQEDSWIMRAAVEELWPDLTQYPVNGKPFRYTTPLDETA